MLIKRTDDHAHVRARESANDAHSRPAGVKYVEKADVRIVVCDVAETIDW